MLHDGTDSAGVVLILQGGFQRAVLLWDRGDGESLSGSSLRRDGAAIGIICRGGEGMQTSGLGPLAAVIGASMDELSPPSAEGQRRGGGTDRALLFVEELEEFKSTSSVQ